MTEDIDLARFLESRLQVGAAVNTGAVEERAAGAILVVNRGRAWSRRSDIVSGGVEADRGALSQRTLVLVEILSLLTPSQNTPWRGGLFWATGGV